MVENNESFFQEIEEDVRLERLEKLWKQYNTPIITGVVAFAVLISGGLYWNHSHKEHKNSLSQQYSDALVKISKGNNEEGLSLLDGLKNEKGYGALAMLMKASVLAKQKETLPQALEIYKEVSQNSSYDKNFNKLGTLMLSYNEFDTHEADKVRENLEILKDINNPWQALGIELEAALEDKLGNKDKAKELYKQLSEDAGATQAMRARALAMLIEYK